MAPRTRTPKPAPPPKNSQPPSTIEQTVEALDQARAVLIDAGDPDIGLGTIDELGRRAFALERARVHVQSLLDQLQIAIPEAMPADVVPIVGCGTLVRDRRRSARWKDPEASERLRDYLRRQIAKDIATRRDRATGEVRRRPRVEAVAAEAAKATMDAIGSFTNVVVEAQHRYELDLSWFRVSDKVDVAIFVPEGYRW